MIKNRKVVHYAPVAVCMPVIPFSAVVPDVQVLGATLRTEEWCRLLVERIE